MEQDRPWSWPCDDDEEALGVSTLLGRHGLNPTIRDVEGQPTVFVAPDEVERARTLESRLRDRWVTKVDGDTRRGLERRERWGWRVLLVLVGLTAVGVWLSWP